MSFFKKKEKKAPIKTVVLPTGGEIDAMVEALCKHANDQDSKVRKEITSSLIELGRKQYDLVLSSATNYLISNRSETSHRITLLKILEKIISCSREKMNPSLAEPMMDVCMSDMVREKNVVAEHQGQASTVLVSLGLRFPDYLMERLMAKFTTGTVPHYFIIKTLGDFALTNPLAVVPHLKSCFARLIPMLGSIKQDNIKWVCASTIAKFCEAIVTFEVDTNHTDMENENLKSKSFSGEILPAFEILFNNWLGSRKQKVRTVTLQAVGAMCAILAQEEFENQLPKIISSVLSMYKKDKEHLPITLGLCTILEVAIKDENRVLMPHLNNLLSGLHGLACQPPDMNDSNSIKNHNELLRCFGIMGIEYCDDVVTFLLGRLDPRISKSPVARNGTLNILRHLVTRLQDKMGEVKALLVSGIQPLARTEEVVEVKKTMAQLVIAMASHDYLRLEGGEASIEFIVTNCAITDTEIADYSIKKEKSKKSVGDSPEELRNICDNVLNLVTTTIPCMENALWPYLLELVIPPKYTSAMAILCKSLAFLASKKREEEADDYYIDFDVLVNIPKPPELVARLLVFLGVPLRRGRLGLRVLHLLHGIGPILNPDIADMWDNAIPKLAKYLQENSSDLEDWNSNSWEDLVLRLLSETIKVVGDEEWTMALGEELFKHLQTFYETDSDLKRTCFKHLGLVLQKLTKKVYIKEKLTEVFACVNHNDDLESLGCAQAFGYAGAAHLDIVLEKVNETVNSKPKKSGGFFSFGSSKSLDKGQPMVTAMIAYGYIASYASPSLLTTRLDVHIINNMKPHMKTTSNKKVQANIIKALDLIGKAVHPSNLGAAYRLKQRDELMEDLLEIVRPTKKKSEFCGNEMAKLGLISMNTLTLLEPPLPDTLEKSLLERACTFIEIGIPKKKKKEKKKKEKEEEAAPDAGTNKEIEAILDQLNDLLSSVLFMDCATTTFSRLFRVLTPYTNRENPLVRQRAVATTLVLLKKFVEYTNTNVGNRKEEKYFDKMGQNLAKLIPRCTDPAPQIRQKALEALGIMLFIDHMLRKRAEEGGEGDQVQPPAVLRPLNSLREKLASKSINEQYSVMQNLSQILAKTISPEDLPDLLFSLFSGLTDFELSSSSGTCVVLNGMIKLRGEELEERVPEILTGLLEEMDKITHEQTLNATLHAVRNLAHHHPLPVVNHLLGQKVPHSANVVKSFQVIAKDKDLVLGLVNHLIQILNYSLLMKEKGVGKKSFSPLPIPMSATCALSEIMQSEELQEFIQNNYALFVCTLMLRVGTCTGMGQALDQIIEAIRQFVECNKETEIKEMMDKTDGWSRLKGNRYCEVITDITHIVGEQHKDDVPTIFKFIYPFFKGNYPGHRLVTATVVAELVNHTYGNSELLQHLVNALLLGLSDAELKISCLRGLGNVVSAGKEEVDKYATTILDALGTCVDSPDEELAMEAMDGLSKVYELVEEGRVAPTLINLCHRIRPAFEKPNDRIRCSSFTLFGTLSRFGKHSLAEAPFFEQIHNHIPTLVLHINDPNEKVQQACKKTLRRFGPLMRATEVEQFLADTLKEGNASFEYDEFLMDFAKLLITHYTEGINFYVMTTIEFFSSSWTELRGSAATFVGALLGQLPREERMTLNTGMISQALIGLLKQKDPGVRLRCAR
eukprot:CAMPEP_0174265646 /NCGR_PEP_ID=MMETSP0439-20130205/27313_1 /TAXON_ID=0 /ORGANISM="Stereomyxa ramosa, Strain Chinc5" /LENGTH=1648 /DNA_ID=CAMNT_0015352207 /DNA_START=52 /DNA_END=4994 /DNA_ORIENTATION=-